MAQLIEQATTSTSRKENDGNEERSARISARTARRWLRRLGLKHKRVSKRVFVDGHDREDAVRHRQGVPTPTIDSSETALLSGTRMLKWLFHPIYRHKRSPTSRFPIANRPLMLMTASGIYGLRKESSPFGPREKARELWFPTSLQLEVA